MTILTAVGLIYIGYVIGIIHAAITSQKELNRQKELTNEYAKIVAELTASMQDYIEINGKEAVNGTADKDNE